jgi:hypothetical protein
MRQHVSDVSRLPQEAIVISSPGGQACVATSCSLGSGHSARTDRIQAKLRGGGGAQLPRLQFVNVAAGLDSRAFRLPWPANTHVYEVDRSEVRWILCLRVPAILFRLPPIRTCTRWTGAR